MTAPSPDRPIGTRAPSTIDDVIAALDRIIEDCHRQGSRLGFFPAMYRKTTIEVKRGIESGRFEDPERLERLDVLFAHRYLAAYDRFLRGESPTRAWHYAFRMGGSARPRVIQHLLLGMNAHINLDLGISAVDVAPGDDLVHLRHDFDEINAILGELVDRVQDDLSSVFPLLGALDFLCLRFDETAVRIAVRQARSRAWRKAEALAHAGSDERVRHIEHFDHETLDMARTICGPENLPEDADAASDCEIDPRDTATVRRVIDALLD